MNYDRHKAGRKKAGFFALLILLSWLCLLPQNAQASAYQYWSGVWLTNHGELKLTQDGEKVAGTYCVNHAFKGRLEGVIGDEWGFILRGRYYEGADSGVFEFRIIESNESFQGWRGSCDNSWSGRRKGNSGSEIWQQEIVLMNNSPYGITAFFISPANSEDWREVLGGAELRCGKQRNVLFDLDADVSSWDIKIVDSSGSFTVISDLQIKREFSSINYYYKDGAGQLRFAVG